MALIKCPSCAKEISSEAGSCPSCGHPINPQKQKSTSVFGIVVKVIIALFIIGIGAFVLFCAVPFFGIVGKNVADQLDESKIENTKIQIVQLESGLKLFKVDNRFYPETRQGLDALVVFPKTGRQPRRYDSSGYLDGDQLPLDQWGSEFIYIGPDETGSYTYEVISPGPDGVPQTDDDISSRNIR